VDHRDPAWLASQRWFRSKQRTIARVTEFDRAPLTERGSLVVIDVTYADDDPGERYLVPLVDGREPEDGDGAWRALARTITSGTTQQGECGRFVATPLIAETVGDSAPERRLRVEQSNTSAVLDERLILKLYRLLEPGENPDVEVSAFLTTAGFTDTPAVAGSLAYVDGVGTRSAAAMLQTFVPSRGDAWAAMLHALADDSASAARLAADIGGLTRRLHAALACRPDDPDFPARTATPAEAGSWRESAEQQLELAVRAVTGDERAQLTALAPHVSTRFDDGFGTAAGSPVSRIHGDYHLGQLLARTDRGYSVIDFEGEPARPLAERREPASPLRDVAGMLRSFDYAARTVAADDAESRAAFLTEYGCTPDDPLLTALELEKACYEVRYEASNRPAWLWLPLAALARLVRR
jgi:trehalose synthase-fused probable maltokinase